MAATNNPLLEPLEPHHDMVLETRKRDGDWVATPVNPLVEDDHVYFRTWRQSGKAKRLRNFAEVRFAPSTLRGDPTGAWLEGRALQLSGREAEHAASLINRRYPVLQGVMVRLFHRLRGLRTQHYRIDLIRPSVRPMPGSAV